MYKGMQGRENPLSNMLSQHNFYVYDILLEPVYGKSGTITKSIRRVMFLSNMTGQSIFSFNTYVGRSLVVKMLRNSSKYLYELCTAQSKLQYTSHSLENDLSPLMDINTGPTKQIPLIENLVVVPVPNPFTGLVGGN